MPRVCTVCASSSRKAIETEILESKPFRQIATRYNVSNVAIHRHVNSGHLTELMVKAKDAGDVLNATDIVNGVRKLVQDTEKELSESKPPPTEVGGFAPVG